MLPCLLRFAALFSFGFLFASVQVALAQACAPLPPPSTAGFTERLQQFLDTGCHKQWVQDPRIRTTNGVHPNVKVYFSPGMWNWMGNRTGDVPDGAIVVKEQYGFTAGNTTVSDWAVMVRDSGGAWDGWYWADLVPGSSPELVSPDIDCDEASYPAAIFGAYCINCHASAADGQNTYATDQFIKRLVHSPSRSTPPLSGAPEDDIHYRLSHMRRLRSASPKQACMVPESQDHVVAEGKSAFSHRLITSDQCAGCHNATGTLTPARPDLPSMLFYKQDSAPATPRTVNLSPSGEWRFSMMGLAGRDPIFFSQLNSESTLHDNLTDHPGAAKEFVQDLCLSCHGVMGQRQFHADNQGPYFTRDKLNESTGEYGALGRDGISCAVCHRMSADGLGTPDTYTGRFKLNDGTQYNGPFNDVVKLPMQNAIGADPVQAPQITDSTMCGSCHTIILPVYKANGDQMIDPATGKQKMFTEQATFFEWQNSVFRDGGPQAQSCQECHMPNIFLENGVSHPLSYKIANIEDNTFPAVEHRAPDADITLTQRDGYRRHLLLGINVFALEMVKQFRNELGLYAQDPMLRPSLNTDPGIDNAIDTSVNMIAKTRTADLHIDYAGRAGNVMRLDITVKNKAGHSFPSGVGFRRAFLTVEVLSENGDRIWCSGCLAPVTSDQSLKGLIVDGATGQPLLTETFTPTQQNFQPHFWFGGQDITQQNQVQIYEELVRNPEGFLSTSFIALNETVKDNRLQPLGWSPDGPHADDTKPVGTCNGIEGTCDPAYQNGSGGSTVQYVVTSEALRSQNVQVRATLNYQTIPPYYQAQRFGDASGIDTGRLMRFTQNLKVANTAISNWALPVASEFVTIYPNESGVPSRAF